MTAAGPDIELVVKEVMRRLRIGERDVVKPDKGRSSQSTGAVTAAHDAPAQWVCTHRVVTLTALDEIGDGVRRVVVPRDAVVTPAVVDRLKELGMELARDRANGQRLDVRCELFLQCWRTQYETAGLLSLLQEQGPIVSQIAGDEPLGRILAALAGQSRSGSPARLGLILTDQPAVALCLANRHPRLRATWGSDPKCVSEAVESIAANLLIVQPDRVGAAPLETIVKQYVSNPQRTCPEAVSKLFAATGA